MKSKQSSITNGPRNIFSKLRRVTQFADKQVRDIALKVLRRNAIFAHPAHVILLRCLTMKKKTVRVTAVDKIMSLRETLTAGLTNNFKKQAARK